MRIRSLTLKNIRSYVDGAFDFPEGLVLLAGDIGAGKSTILLSIEFALFGIQRGELSGTSLLRHGAQQGRVTLHLEMEGKEIILERGLKRTATGVGQETGRFTLDGVTTDLTAVELKAKVLELLNYPSSLLSTGKRPLFRYTVYTPQEEMKSILYEKAEERLETLRRLFNIDKYKRVRENALLLIRELRKEETDVSARIDELGKLLREEFDERLLRKASEEKKELEKKLVTLEVQWKEQQRTLEKMEKERFMLEELKKGVALANSRVEMLRTRREEVLRDEKEVAKQIAETDLKKSDVNEDVLKKRAVVLKEQEQKILAKERAILKREAEHQATINQVDSLVEKIQRLDTCPTCKQGVTAEHKAHIGTEEGARKEKAQKSLSELEELKEQLATHREKLLEKEEELLQKERLVAANKEKLLSLERMQKKLVQIGEVKERLANEIVAEEKKVMTFTHDLKEKAFDREVYEQQKRLAHESQELVTKEKMLLVGLQKDIERLEKEQELVKKRQKEHQVYEERARHIAERLTWLNKQLINVSHTVEKQLFSTVYGLFNEYFKEWFSMLMEDETLTVRLDSDFCPVIVQDGYETIIEHLSGGEKTSIALAYRLSLNKAINEFLTEIKTSDLLILDEPTDGFSSEQLDRVREVLDQLHLKQVLIVSHEQQMEGYVDHILRIGKEGHESKVVA